MNRLLDALKVFLGIKSAVCKKTLKEIYKLIPMNQDTKDKLTKVKDYLAGLPAKFAALQAQVDLLKSDDDSDKAKITDLTSQVDALKLEQVEIVTFADELSQATDTADIADGEG